VIVSVTSVLQFSPLGALQIFASTQGKGQRRGKAAKVSIAAEDCFSQGQSHLLPAQHACAATKQYSF